MEVILEGRKEEDHIKGYNRLKTLLENQQCEFEECIVKNVHGFQYTPTPEEEEMEDTLLILNFSAPSGFNYEEEILREIDIIDSESIPLKDYQSDYFKYSQGSPPMDYTIALDKRGRVIGYKRNHIVWIPFDLIHEDFDEKLYYYIFYQLFPYWKDYKPENVSRDKFYEVYRQFVEHEARRLEAEIESRRSALIEAARTYQERLRDYTLVIVGLENAKKDVERLKENAEDTINRIINHSEIEEVKFLANGRIKVITKPILLANKYNIGKYAIYLGGRDVVIFKVGLPRSYYQHPHIENNGRICWGNFERIYDAYSRGEWDAVVTACIELLHSYNRDSSFRKLEDFLEEHCPETYEQLSKDLGDKLVRKIVNRRIYT